MLPTKENGFTAIRGEMPDPVRMKAYRISKGNNPRKFMKIGQHRIFLGWQRINIEIEDGFCRGLYETFFSNN